MTLILLLTTSRYKSSSTIKIIDREAFVTAEMIRNAYQGIGSEYETLLGVLDKDNATFQKHAGTDRVKGAYMERVRAKIMCQHSSKRTTNAVICLCLNLLLILSRSLPYYHLITGNRKFQ